VREGRGGREGGREGERERERERERRECAYARVHALGLNGKTVQVFFYYLVVKARFFFYKSYLATNVLVRSLTLLISVWDRGLTDGSLRKQSILLHTIYILSKICILTHILRQMVNDMMNARIKYMK